MKETLVGQSGRLATAVACAALVAVFGTALPQSARAEQVGQAIDPAIAAAVKGMSAARVQSDIEKLVSFGTRHTLSVQDPEP